MKKEGELKNLYCNMNLERSLFSADCNSDHSILFVEGTPEEVNIKITNLLKVSSLAEYSALRVKVIGKVVKEQNTCCLISTIFAAGLLIPIFCVCTEWWRKTALRLVEVPQTTYQLISELLKRNNFQECYLHLEDNFLNREKLKLLSEGLRFGVSNLLLMNIARNFNVEDGNSSNFAANLQPILRDVKNAEIRWQKTVISNTASRL